MIRDAPAPWVVALCVVLSLSLLAVGGTGAADLAPEAGTAHELGAVQQQQQGTLEFAPLVFRDVGGQVATEDGEVAVRGQALGFDEVLVAMVDRRGRIASEILTVDDDDVFEGDVALVTADGTPLGEGGIVATVFTTGRDGVVGDGEIAGFTRADLEALDENARQKARERLANETVVRTQEQVLEFFYEESINDTGSDDQALLDVFVLTSGRTTVEHVYPTSALNETEPENRTGVQPVRVGETMVVRGLTNRKPEDNVITVEAVEGPTPLAFDFADTDQWGVSGQWAVTLETEGVEPGTYVFEVDDGDATDTVEVRILPAVDGNATNDTAAGTQDNTTSGTPDDATEGGTNTSRLRAPGG